MAPRLRDDDRLTAGQRERLCGQPEERKSPRKPYKRTEDLEEDWADATRVSGKDLWERMAFRFVVLYGFRRTWQSLKERFFKRIVPNLDRFKEVPVDFRRWIRECLENKRHESIALGRMEDAL